MVRHYGHCLHYFLCYVFTLNFTTVKICLSGNLRFLKYLPDKKDFHIHSWIPCQLTRVNSPTQILWWQRYAYDFYIFAVRKKTCIPLANQVNKKVITNLMLTNESVKLIVKLWIVHVVAVNNRDFVQSAHLFPEVNVNNIQWNFY